MTEEEKRLLREHKRRERRAYWEKMTPQERRERRRAAYERFWSKKTPEERRETRARYDLAQAKRKAAEEKAAAAGAAE